MAFSYVLSTQNGFFRRKDLLFPDILFTVISVFLLTIGSGGSYYLLAPILAGISFGALAYFLLAGGKSYILYWLNHALAFSLLLPRDSRYLLQAILAQAIGLGIWWVGENRLKVRFPLSILQFLIFLIFYLLPGIDGWISYPGFGFRENSYSDLYTVGFAGSELLPAFRFSALEASGGFGILFLLPLLLKRNLAVFLPLVFGLLLSLWSYSSGIPGWETVSGPVWSGSFAFLLLLNLPGRNTGSLLPLSFLALAPIGLGIFFLPASYVPTFLWVSSFFFIESLLIRIFLGDRIERHEPAPRFT
ncbi:hypothetical protein EHQ53_14290 [Leptospira langatensis]|uniref:Uncharacterized protein n=1 Tax=Leptospira langatensis TaxID=2484983 RepID=A0A5F1ZSR6_9LEPT|nr:hypothetical protein [Leptospira langatensis]TGK01142.1 hypothetical protein EHO57_09335 [Leptospira langatensis]TGL39561.1 hypothetical protein EHQ53_14290 [Leptospira langatensis]